MLRLAGTDKAFEDQLRPIPFPRHRVAGRRADSGRRGRPGLDANTDSRTEPDTARLVDDAIEDVQSRIDELDSILNEPLSFPGRDTDDGDDRPPAA